MSRNGQAYIDIEHGILVQVIGLLPSTYRIVGSGASPSSGVVRLVLESEDIAPDPISALTCEVRDVRSTRTVRMMPCSIPGPAMAA